MTWKMDDSRPIYLQIMEIIQTDIVSGKYQAGDKLPSVRELALQASVNPNTMQKALAELERIGLLYSQRTTGRFVTTDETMIQNLRHQLASILVNDFHARMKQLGFIESELYSFLAEKTKGEF